MKLFDLRMAALAAGIAIPMAAMPAMALPVFGFTAVWMLAAMILAVRQALDYRSTARAVAACVLGWTMAIVMALRNTYRIAIIREHPLHEFAVMALSVQVLIVGLCFTGPAFNTQLGILFWLMTAVIFAAQRTAIIQYEIEAEAEAQAQTDEYVDAQPDAHVLAR